jgi:hypothetical protein
VKGKDHLCVAKMRKISMTAKTGSIKCLLIQVSWHREIHAPPTFGHRPIFFAATLNTYLGASLSRKYDKAPNCNRESSSWLAYVFCFQ